MKTDSTMRSDGITDVERPWMQLVHVCGPLAARDELIEIGLSNAVASGLVVWLLDQNQKRRVVTEGTAMKYRKLLKDAGNPKGLAPIRFVSSPNEMAA